MAQLENRSDRNRRGSIIVLAAACLIIAVAFVAFAVDIGYLSVVKTQLQNAADAAALAGANSLSTSSSAAVSAAKTVGLANSAAGHAVSIPDSDIELGSWDPDALAFTALSGAAQANADTVKVTCRCSNQNGTSVTLFFAKVIGVTSADLNATAYAKASPSRCGLIIGLNSVTMSGSAYTDSYSSSLGAYGGGNSASKGHVCSNGKITMSGSSAINGDAHPGIGKTVVDSSSNGVTGSTTPMTKALSYAASDTSYAATHNNNNNIPLTAQNKDPLDSHNNFSLSGSDTITLPAGTYYFAKLSLSGSSSISVNGAVIIYCTDDVAFSGGTILNTTQIPSNLILYASGSTTDISGSADFYGVVYAPTSKVTRSGTASYFGSIIGLTVTMSGSGGIHADTSIGGLVGSASHNSLVK